MPNILTPAGHGSPMGRIAMKEQISEVKVVWSVNEDGLTEKVNEAIKNGFQPVPQTFTWNNDCYSMVCIKTEIKEQMI